MTETNKNINSGSGYLYENKEKQGRQPDFKGRVTINGKEYLAAAWKKSDKQGEEFLSIAITDPDDLPKTYNQSNGNSQSQTNNTPSQQNNDIPKIETPAETGKVPDPDFGGDTFFDSMFKE